jgi:hypothetical protein
MNTPRTDAARWQLVCHFDQGGEYDANPKRANDGDWVPVEICQQLETELAVINALADRLAEALQRQRGFPYCPRAKVLSRRLREPQTKTA